MIKLKIIKNLPKFVFIFLLLFSCGKLFAEDSGQVININQNYQIAFTDLGNRVLKQGDIVKVFINTDEFVYMQVVESSVILSKLAPSKADGFQTNLSDFQRIAVGNVVSKVSATQGVVDNSVGVAAPPVTENKDTGVSSQLQIQKLEEELAQAKEQIRLLEESNERSKAAVAVPQEQTSASKETLEQLKEHLDNMSKIVSETD
jgi:hypothetical protein